MYRLKVFQIHIAPLRERATDIPLLAQHFLAQLAARYARPELCLDSRALTALVQYPWPGNVRELRNVLERAVLLQRSGVLAAEDLALPAQRPMPASPRTSTPPVGASLESVEREHLLQALHASNWNVTQAARRLGISRDTLRYRMERHGLQR